MMPAQTKKTRGRKPKDPVKTKKQVKKIPNPVETRSTKSKTKSKDPKLLEYNKAFGELKEEFIKLSTEYYQTSEKLNNSDVKPDSKKQSEYYKINDQLKTIKSKREEVLVKTRELQEKYVEEVKTELYDTFSDKDFNLKLNNDDSKQIRKSRKKDVSNDIKNEYEDNMTSSSSLDDSD